LRQAAWKSAPDRRGGSEYRRAPAPAGPPGRAGQVLRLRTEELYRRPRGRRAHAKDPPRALRPARIETPSQDAFLSIEAILGSVEIHRLRPIDDFVGDFFAPMGREAMHENGLGFCSFHEPGIDLVGLK